MSRSRSGSRRSASTSDSAPHRCPLLLALPLAACGGTSDVTSLDPVAQAADRTTSVAGAHFQMSARIGDQSKTIAFSGPGELADHGKKLHMHLSLPASVLGAGGHGKAQLELVGSGSAYYLRGGPFEQIARGKWVKVKETDPSFDLGQNDPSQMLQYLRATSNVDEVGKDTDVPADSDTVDLSNMLGGR